VPEGRIGTVVAVDGPSGSGKSSVCRAVAEQLGMTYLDTGAMYRAVCWAALERGIDLGDHDAVAELAGGTQLGFDISLEGRPYVEALGQDITAAIRNPRISDQVSRVATNPKVRAILQAWQRRIIEEFRYGRGIVVEGRDITTVVAPDAEVRILLTADARARVARRQRELQQGAQDPDLDATVDQVLRRDADDSTVSQFLTAALGVHSLDTSNLDLEDVVEAVIDLVRSAQGVRSGVE